MECWQIECWPLQICLALYGLTLVLLNKLRCHAHFKFSANQIII